MAPAHRIIKGGLGGAVTAAWAGGFGGELTQPVRDASGQALRGTWAFSRCFTVPIVVKKWTERAFLGGSFHASIVHLELWECRCLFYALIASCGGGSAGLLESPMRRRKLVDWLAFSQGRGTAIGLQRKADIRGGHVSFIPVGWNVRRQSELVVYRMHASVGVNPFALEVCLLPARNPFHWSLFLHPPATKRHPELSKTARKGKFLYVV